MELPQHDHRPMLAKDGMTGTGAQGETCRLRSRLSDSAAQTGVWGLPVEVKVSRSKAKQLWKVMATMCLDVDFIQIMADGLVKRVTGAVVLTWQRMITVTTGGQTTVVTVMVLFKTKHMKGNNL